MSLVRYRAAPLRDAHVATHGWWRKPSGTRCSRSFREDFDQGDDGAEDDDGLKADRADDPFENVGSYRLKVGFSGEVIQIVFCRKIGMGGLPKRLGDGFRLLVGKMAFVAQGLYDPERVEKNCVHIPTFTGSTPQRRRSRMESLSRFGRRRALAQPHARPAAVLGDELDAGSFEGGADGGEIVGGRRAFSRLEVN